jgi:hypothetical protein
MALDLLPRWLHHGRVLEPKSTRSSLIVPSSSSLMGQIARAMAKCDGDIEQAALRKEAEADRRMERHWTAEAQARSHRARWGVRAWEG